MKDVLIFFHPGNDPKALEKIKGEERQMKHFEPTRAESFAEASELLKTEGTVAIAGGTDFFNILETKLLPDYPETAVDIKYIQGADRIKAEDGVLRIGALAKLSAVADSQEVQEKLPLLAEAAKSVGTPSVRNQGTIGGNICQDVRCRFYRGLHEDGSRLVCMRKGGDTCYAIQGDNRGHSVFGGLKTQSTPCTRSCPVNIDIPAFMSQLRLGNVPGAAQIILQANPMPMLTGRVCAHSCQDQCNQCNSGESVAIRNVERYVGDYILEHQELFFKAPLILTGKKVAIVGAGPSGLAAAYYLRKEGNEVTVYDSNEEAGGMMMYAIPAYRLPKDIVRKFVAALSGMGIAFILKTKVGQDIAPAELEKKYDSVYYAEDTQAASRPGIFVGGEVATGPATVVQAIVNGRNIAKSINKYLRVDDSHVCVGMQIHTQFLFFDKEGIKNKESLKLDVPPASERSADGEDEISPSWEQAAEEARRCMNCGCYAVNPSDIAPVLVALDATIKTTRRSLKADEFCCEKLRVSEVLQTGELVTEIEIPLLKGAIMHYDKFCLGEAEDFASVGLATIFGTQKGKITGARIVLGGVAPIPIRLNRVEGFLVCKEINEQTAKEAAELAVKNTFPMEKNSYKVDEIKAMLSRAILRLA